MVLIDGKTCGVGFQFHDTTFSSPTRALIQTITFRDDETLKVEFGFYSSIETSIIGISAASKRLDI